MPIEMIYPQGFSGKLGYPFLQLHGPELPTISFSDKARPSLGLFETAARCAGN